MTRNRRRFYLGLAIVFPLFYLLHWNGMFSHTYEWVLAAIHGPQQSGSHPVAAFISAVMIFTIIALVFEGVHMLTRRAT